MKIVLQLVLCSLLSLSYGLPSSMNREYEGENDLINHLLKEDDGSEMNIDKRFLKALVDAPISAINKACKVRSGVQKVQSAVTKVKGIVDKLTKRAVLDSVCKVADLAKGGVMNLIKNPVQTLCAGKGIIDGIRHSKDKHVQKRFWNFSAIFSKIKNFFKNIFKTTVSNVSNTSLKN